LRLTPALLAAVAFGRPVEQQDGRCVFEAVGEEHQAGGLEAANGGRGAAAQVVTVSH
jgi:hypothetical protein